MDLDEGSDSHGSPCLSSCLQNFGNMISPSDRDFDQVCRILSTQTSPSIFSSLYCCDFDCGIKFGDGARHDQNVNQVISKCKSFGISNIIDPGPPQASKCPAILVSNSLPAPLTPTIPSSTGSTASTSTSQSTSLVPLSLSTSVSTQPTTFITSSSQTIIQTIAPSSSPATTSNTPVPTPSRTFLQTLSLTSKIGLILGLTLLILLLLLLTFFLIRHKRRLHLRLQQLPNFPSGPRESSLSNSTLVTTSTSETGSGGNEGVGRTGIGREPKLGQGCRNAKIVVIETQGRNDIDERGYRWPDRVVLEGEAREMREWSMGYGLVDEVEKRRDRRKEKMVEYDLGL